MNGCKIDHNDPDRIPQILCLTCNPRKPSAAPVAREIVMPEVTEEQKLRYQRKIKRRLRAEVRQIRSEIDTIDGRNPPVTKQLEAKLLKAYADLALADD